jgi:ribosomal protein S18 acetylase RimI-like enzyme
MAEGVGRQGKAEGAGRQGQGERRRTPKHVGGVGREGMAEGAGRQSKAEVAEAMQPRQTESRDDLAAGFGYVVGGTGLRQTASVIVRVSPADVGVFEEAARRFAGQAAGAAAFAQSPGTIAFVAVEDDDVQGWCWGYLLPRPDGASMLYLHNLEVTEHCRRQGIGRGLLQSFMDAGVRLGAGKMFLTTGENNSPARHLYESMGAGLASQGPTVNYWFLLPKGAPEPMKGEVRPGLRRGSR